METIADLVEKVALEFGKAKEAWLEECARVWFPPYIYNKIKEQGVKVSAPVVEFVGRRSYLAEYPDRCEFWYAGKLRSTFKYENKWTK